MTSRRRLIALAALFALVFVSLFARLLHLQVLRHDHYERRAADVRRRVEYVDAPRGRILDRRGRVLAEDVPTYRLAAVLEDVDPGIEAVERLGKVLRRPRPELHARLRALRAEAAADAGDGRPARDRLLAEATTERAVPGLAAVAKRVPGLRADGRALYIADAALLGRDATLARLAELTGATAGGLAARLDAEAARAFAVENPLDRAARLEAPVPLGPPVPFEVAAEVEEQAFRYPGIVVEVRPERRYPRGPVAAHVVGLLGPLSDEDLARLRASGRLLDARRGLRDLDRFEKGLEGAHFADDRVGRDGVEAAAEAGLRGTPGARLVERDRRTREMAVLAEAPPRPGADVRLTIDADVAAATEEALDRAIRRSTGGAHGGSAVLLDVRTGDVLVLASAPRYDPNRFGADYASLRESRAAPLLHRALRALLPPGSTVKPIVVLGALEEGLAIEGAPLRPATRIHCRGFLHRPGEFQCNARSGHGSLDLEQALARSCNVYFYVIGEALGEAGLTRWARRFGLGARTGIDLPGEGSGLVPSTPWKRARAASAERRAVWAGEQLAASATAPVEVRRERLAVALRAARWARATRVERAWGRGDSRNIAIGQGDLLVTPLQAARLGAMLATGGRAPAPRVIPGGTDRPHLIPLPEGEGRWEPAGAMPPAHAAPAAWEAVAAGLRAAVSAPGGTARASGLVAFRAAAKTGTAQAGPAGDHAWVVGYAPGHAPEVAFAVVIEHISPGLHGGDVAGPVAAAMLAAWERSRDAGGRP